MIYYDPTENRFGKKIQTRLDKSVIDAGKELNGLEKLTSADLLVTPVKNNIEIPQQFINAIEENVLHIIGRFYNAQFHEIAEEVGVPIPAIISTFRFWQACQAGILIQRKSGGDFSSSIPKLSEIIGRMILWSPDPWLLIAADIKCNRNGKAVIDGRESHFTHKQVVSSKMSWMFSGGNVIEIPRDNLTTDVISYAERKLTTLNKDKNKLVVRRKWSRQNIVGPNDKRWKWMNVLADLPGIGSKRAIQLANYAGSLANALVFLSDTNAVKDLGRNDVARVSDSIAFRKLLDIGENNQLTIIGDYKYE